MNRSLHTGTFTERFVTFDTTAFNCSFSIFFTIPRRALQVQRPKKWLVRGLVKFVTAVARLVCPDLLG